MGYLDNAGLQYFWDKLKEKFAPKSHSHDDRYYTETEMNAKLNGKSNTGHTHDDRYYTETEINTKLNGKANSSHTHTKSQITDFPASLKNPTALTIQTNGATAATYDGSAAKTVNVTKGNIGLGNVDNTADANKSVKYATSAGSASTATKATTADVANFAKETYINQYKTVNLTDLDQNTWYPVTGASIPYNGLRRFKCNVQLNSGSKPSWSTHGRGFTAVVDILEEASGWGTTNMQGIVLINNQCFINDSNKPPVGYGQMGNSSTPVWWLRGGGTYFLATDYNCTWTIQKSKYEIDGQNVAPKTTYPGVSVNRATITANLNGNANTSEVAVKLARSGNTSYPMTFNWSGKSGQPTWLWGGENGTDMYVYNPSNFDVNYAKSAGSVAWGNVSGKPSTFTPASHTHNYAGSGSAGGSANSAVKLDSSAGSNTQPVYFKDGKPVVIGYTIAKSVPANAKFTDTTYSNMGGASTSSAGKSGLVPAPAAGAANRYLRSDGTWQVPPDTNTWRGIQNNLTSNSTTDSLSAAQGKELKILVDKKANENHSHSYLPLSGGAMTGYLDFGQTSTGLSWTCANGDIYHFRPYSPNNDFQLTRQNPSSKIGEYGVLNITGNGDIFFGRPGFADAFPMLGTVACGPNYIRFGDGTQICWGAITYNYQSASEISFPVPFVNTSYAVSGFLSVHSGVEKIIRFGNKSTSSFRITIQNGVSSQLDWMAIGRWC